MWHIVRDCEVCSITPLVLVRFQFVCRDLVEDLVRFRDVSFVDIRECIPVVSVWHDSLERKALN